MHFSDVAFVVAYTLRSKSSPGLTELRTSTFFIIVVFPLGLSISMTHDYISDAVLLCTLRECYPTITHYVAEVLDGHLVHGTMYSVGLQLLGGGTAVSGHTFTSSK